MHHTIQLIQHTCRGAQMCEGAAQLSFYFVWCGAVRCDALHVVATAPHDKPNQRHLHCAILSTSLAWQML